MITNLAVCRQQALVLLTSLDAVKCCDLKWPCFSGTCIGAAYGSQSFKKHINKAISYFFLQVQIIHADFCKAPALVDKPWLWNLQS